MSSPLLATNSFLSIDKSDITMLTQISIKRIGLLSLQFLVFGLFLHPGDLRADALDRLALERLKATHQAIEALRLDRQPVSLPSTFQDHRAVMHVHSLLSHDSRGKPEEIRASAKMAGVSIVMFTEHPAPHYDYFKDGHRGLVDGVLFIPGAEKDGLLSYPLESVPPDPNQDPQFRLDAVLKAHGLAFLSHLEERMDWNLKGLTGSEIYNIHADLKNESRLVKLLKSPLGLMPLMAASRVYPQEALGALQDYPDDYLKRWDELCVTTPLTGIAANDAHHNIGIKGIVTEKGILLVEDNLGKKVLEMDPSKNLLALPLIGKAKPGQVAFAFDLDPYELSFRHVSTHLLIKELTEEQVRQALQMGRAYVAFDWLGDPTGFNFQAVHGLEVHEMGSEFPLQPGLHLRSVSPLPVRFRLVRDGKEVHSSLGRTFDYAVQEPGNYRVELWLNLPDGPQIWILSNPIYVRAGERK
jgi:hypothetical protein